MALTNPWTRKPIGDVATALDELAARSDLSTLDVALLSDAAERLRVTERYLLGDTTGSAR